jgi:hypothetical protein
VNAQSAAQAEQAATAARFIDNGDGTVTDTTTGLMWSQATLECGRVKHADAEKACAALDLGGHSDWRMPSVDELFALADRTRINPAIDTNAFSDTESDWYWSSTITAWNSSCAWLVNFSYGNAYSYGRGYAAFVRAVRAVDRQFQQRQRQQQQPKQHGVRPCRPRAGR